MLCSVTFLPASEGSAVPKHCCSMGSTWPRTIGRLSWRGKGIKTLEASAYGRLWPQPSRLSGAESCEGHSWSLACALNIFMFFSWEGHGVKNWNYRFWHNLRFFLLLLLLSFFKYLKVLWGLFYSWSCISLPGRTLQPGAARCFLHLAVNMQEHLWIPILIKIVITNN